MSRFYSLTVGIVLIFALTAPAQQTPTAPGATPNSARSRQNSVPTVDEQLKVLTGKLNLTSDQQTKARPILQKLHDATIKVVQDQSLSHEERLARIRPERYRARGQIREFLNENQRKRLDKYLQGPHNVLHGGLNGTTPSP